MRWMLGQCKSVAQVVIVYSLLVLIFSGCSGAGVNVGNAVKGGDVVLGSDDSTPPATTASALSTFQDWGLPLNLTTQALSQYACCPGTF